MESAHLFEDLFDSAADEDDDEWSKGELTLPDTLNKTALGILMAQLNQFQQNPSGTFGQFPSPSSSASTSAPASSVPRSIGTNCSDILVRCDEKPLWEALMGYGFLVVFCFALIGNCINLLIYKSDQIRFFIAIRMLCTKLLMNTLMMVVMLPQALRVIRLWDIGGPTDKLYWKFWPYQAYLTNVFGFCAMWLTVLMTAECYIHIFFPSKSKSLCTKQTVWRSYFVILFAALVLASIYPLNRTVSLSTKCNRTIVKINTSQNQLMGFFEKVHTLADMLLSILLPLTLLVFMTALIVWRLWIWPSRHRRRLLAKEKAQAKANGTGGGHHPPHNGHTPATSLLSTAAHQERKKRENHFAAEKRGVTRITLITCFIQLVTETPSMSVLIYVSMYGVNVHREEYICTWQTVSYFLCLCNASLSFFVYITFSTRFRKTMIHRAHLLLHRFCPSIFTEVPDYDSGLLIRPKWSNKLPNNSSATHSQLVMMTSKNNSPRNGSQSNGCQYQANKDDGNNHKQILMIKKGSGERIINGGGGRGSGETALIATTTTTTTTPSSNCKEQQNLGQSSKKSSADSKSEMPHSEFTHFALAKRFLQQKLAGNGTKATAALYLPEGDTVLTETTNSLETIPPPSITQCPGHQLDASAMSKANGGDPKSRPWSNSMNGRVEGTNKNEESNCSRKQSSMTKRSSVCSTMTNSQCDAFL